MHFFCVYIYILPPFCLSLPLLQACSPQSKQAPLCFPHFPMKAARWVFSGLWAFPLKSFPNLFSPVIHSLALPSSHPLSWSSRGVLQSFSLILSTFNNNSLFHIYWLLPFFKFLNLHLSFFIHFFPPGFNKDKEMKTKKAQEGLDKPRKSEIVNLFTHILGGEDKWGAKPVFHPHVAVIREMQLCEHTCPLDAASL